MSEGSQAKYLAALEENGFRFLLQYLNGQSTRHIHKGMELFIPVVRNHPSFGRNSEVYQVNGPFWIPPGVEHEAFSLENLPTLTIIVQLSNDSHEQVAMSDLAQMRQQAIAL